MHPPNELEIVQKRITSLFSDPLCKILMEKSFFTEIQLEALLIDYFTYQTLELDINQSSKAQARLRAKGKSRGSYNRVLRQSRNKLEKTLCSTLLLGYLGILGDARISKFTEISQKMQEYLETRRHGGTETPTSPVERDSPEKGPEDEIELRRQLYQLISGRRNTSS